MDFSESTLLAHELSAFSKLPQPLSLSPDIIDLPLCQILPNIFNGLQKLRIQLIPTTCDQVGSLFPLVMSLSTLQDLMILML